VARHLAQPFYRLVGLAFTLLGIRILTVNLAELSYSGWILVWILSAGFLGVVGGLPFLLSFDGPARFRTPRLRLVGWLGMLLLALLPWSFQYVMVLLIALAYPAARQPQPKDRMSPEPST